MTKPWKQSVGDLAASALVGWAALMVVTVVFSVVIDIYHFFIPVTQGDTSFPLFPFLMLIIGYESFFPYVGSFLFLTVPCYFLLLRGAPRCIRPWHWALCGAVLFALSVLIWKVRIGGEFFSSGNIYIAAALLAIPGAASFFFLSRLETKRKV